MSTRFHGRAPAASVFLALALAGLAGCRRDGGHAPSIAELPPLAELVAPPPAKVRFPRPDAVRGIYLTAWSAGSPKKIENVLAMLERTELNALVIDVRDAGFNYWKTGIPLSAQAGADKIAVVRPDKLMARIEEAGVYPIARIACFRDNFVPVKFPERAVRDSRTGGVWRDRAGYAWLDPYNKQNWQYLAEIVEFALDQGFPEIQLDYVRFPSEGKASSMAFPSLEQYASKFAKPTEVVAEFARFIAERVHSRGAVLSADIFGIVSSGPGDQGIGQELEIVAEPFDLVCPMVYPSHFAKGEYGIKDPNSSPHAIVLKSLQDYAKRLPGKPIRPWLQDFSLGVKYGVAEVQAQIKAAREAGYEEYLLWNPLNRYTEAAVLRENGLAIPEGEAVRAR